MHVKIHLLGRRRIPSLYKTFVSVAARDHVASPVLLAGHCSSVVLHLHSFFNDHLLVNGLLGAYISHSTLLSLSSVVTISPALVRLRPATERLLLAAKTWSDTN